MKALQHDVAVLALQALMRNQAFESVLQATGVELEWRFPLFSFNMKFLVHVSFW